MERFLHNRGISFPTPLQHRLNHLRSDAEVALVQRGENGPGRGDQALLAGQADHCGSAGQLQAKLAGHLPAGALIDQQQHLWAAGQSQADAGGLAFIEVR